MNDIEIIICNYKVFKGNDMISISICLIVKNEENILERCLDSLKDIGDEIIIVDTGSTDRTKEIAFKYTKKVFDFVWTNDFSEARNFAFSKATKEYIYSADADEILDEKNYRRFMAIKKALLKEIEIVQMKYTNQLEFGSTYNFDSEYRPKLFKRLRTFKWIDPIHETIRLDPIIYDSDIEIIHKPNCNHGKRDFKIFEKLINDKINLSKKVLIMFAKELFISGKNEDFIKFKEYFENQLNEEKRSDEEMKYIMCVLAKIYRVCENTDEFFKICTKAVSDNSPSELCYELGEYYFNKKDYNEAIIWYYNATFETESYLNIHYSGDYPLNKLSLCYKELNNSEESKKYKRMAYKWIEDGFK